jgi:hypothetical protein
MKRLIFLLFFVVTACFDPKAEETAIRNLLHAQEIAWNSGNIDAFMEGYWKSDSLKFIGKNITLGWNGTLERYKKTYPDRAAMGQLNFTFYEFRFIAKDACLVTGKYHLKRDADEPRGMFTLLLRKIDNNWVIVYDHTS